VLQDVSDLGGREPGVDRDQGNAGPGHPEVRDRLALYSKKNLLQQCAVVATEWSVENL
jgi:hypothetical protein